MLYDNDCIKSNVTDIINHCYRYYNSFVRLMTLLKSCSLFVWERVTIQMLRDVKRDQN
jgi:hypothetical protein